MFNGIKKFYTNGVFSCKLGHMILLIAQGLRYKPNFINYTYKDDMISDAVFNMCKAIRNKNFDFNKDGTVEVSWINSGDSSKNSYHDGKYSIKKDTVVIKYDDGTKDDVLDYTYKNDTLTLFDVGSDGSLNNELKKQ